MGQACAPKKIEGGPVLSTCKTQGPQHMISMKNVRFSSHSGANFALFVALILLPSNLLITLKLKGHIKGRLISRILNF